MNILKKLYLSILLLIGSYVIGISQEIPCTLNPDPIIDCDTVTVVPTLTMQLAGGLNCFDPTAPIALEIVASDFDAISAIEFVITFDSDHYTYASTSLGELAGYIVDDTNVDQGMLRWFWESPDGSGACLLDGSLLSNMRFSNDLSCEALIFDMDASLSFASVTYNTGGEVCERPINFVSEPMGACLKCDGVPINTTLDVNPCIQISGPDVVDVGDMVCYDFTMADFTSISSLQFTLTFNPQVLSFQSLNDGVLPGGTGALVPNIDEVNSGLLGLVWFDLNGIGKCADDTEVLFTVCFEVVGELGNGTELNISDVLTAIEVGLSVETAFPSCPITDLCIEPFAIDIECTDLFFTWNACSASDIDGMNGSITITPCGGSPKYTIIVPTGGTAAGVCAGESVTFTGLNGSLTSYTVRVIDANGDIYDELVILGDAPALVYDLVGTAPSCENASNGTIAAENISGGVPFTDGTYLLEWSNGIYNATTITGLAAGEYCVTVTDEIGCMVVSCVILEVEPLSVDIEVTQIPTCFMDGMPGDGEIKVTPSGGTAPYFLDNSNVPLDCFVIDNLQPGEHTFTIRDNNGCILDTFAFLDAETEFIFTVVQQTNDCGDGGGFQVFVEIPGQTNVNVAAQVFCPDGPLPCGVLGGDLIICENAPSCEYTIIVSDFVTDCSGITQVTVDEYPPLEVMTTIQEPGCSGMDGKITVDDVIGAIDDITYQWSVFGENESSLCDLPGGNYGLTVSDGRCTKELVFTLMDVDETASVTATCTPIQCDGSGMGGELMSNVTGGMGVSYTYEWFVMPTDMSIANTQNVSDVPPGTYFVIATDATGQCEVRDTCVIENPSEVEIIESGQTPPDCIDSNDGVICIDVVSGENTPLIFSWEGPDNYTSSDSAKIIDAPCGLFTVTVTDNAGCSSVLNVDLQCPPEIIVEITVIEPVICDSLNSGKALAIASGGVSADGNYTFLFSSGSTNFGNIGTGIGFVEGTQTVIACDDNGCCSDPFEFEVPGIIPIELDPVTTMIAGVSCFGDADGSAFVAAMGGDDPYTYAWEDGTMGDINSGLAPGWHVLTITDFDDCEKIDSVFIEEPELLLAEIDLGNTNDIACASEMSGKITVDVVGGTPPYMYQWTGDVSMDNDASGLAEGEYCITVTDVNDCEDIVCHTIGTADPVEAVMDIPEVPDCFGGTSCISVAEVSGGIGNNYTYSVNFGTPISIDSCLEVIAGTYTINVFDSTGCAFETMVDVLQPNPVLVDIGGDITIQLGDTLTQLTVDINSDLPIDSISWSEPVDCIDDNFCNEVLISPSNPTVYSITVTDINGCIGVDDIFVNIEDVRNVFPPNIFSPNGDGQNDEFRIVIGKGVDEVQEFLIYNRWGNLMFESSGNESDTGSYAWDGRFNGQAVEPGVYVYYARISFIDGREIEYKGSVTVVK